MRPSIGNRDFRADQSCFPYSRGQATKIITRPADALRCHVNGTWVYTAPIVRTTTTIKLPLISQKKYAHPRLTTWPKIHKFEELSPSLIVSSPSLDQQFSALDLLIIQGAHSFVTPLFTPRYPEGRLRRASVRGRDILSGFTCRRATPELEAYGTFGRMKKIKVRSIRTLSPNELQAGFLHFAAIPSR